MFRSIIKALSGILITAIVIASLYISVTVPGGISGFWTMISAVSGLNQSADTVENSAFSLPAGFHVDIVAEDLGYARFILVTKNNDLIVSIADIGQILLLEDKDGNGTTETHSTLIEGLNGPQGLAFDGDWLYFSESDKVSRVLFDHSSGRLTGEIEPLITDLPYDLIHKAKIIGISPDRKLHIGVGSPCNVCEPEDPRYAAMLRAELDGSNPQILATGLRNTVGFDWTPWSGELYATSNSRDLLGDDFPPDDLNLIVEGGFYGWPYYHGDNVPDPEFGDKRPDLAAVAIPPAHKFRPHNAPLGIHFVEDYANMPEHLQRTALVALHGSWNRSTLDGYKVVSLHWDSEENITRRDFLSGFITAGGVLGRPVAIAQDQQGHFYITDDLGGRVYRVQYRP